ncbi:M48 family metallopeptidase [Neisseriaceae bacterium TC5R-5]|nr:M48 family metallopeptidase [Neisseriaceae bacterium TC5R-5]
MPVWFRLPIAEGELVDVMLVRRVRKSIAIQIRAGRVELIAHPAIGTDQLKAALLQRQRWIAKHVRQQLAEQAEQNKNLLNICWRGESLPLLFEPGHRPATQRSEQGLHLIGVAADDHPTIKQLLSHYLRREAALCFPAQLATFMPLCRRHPSAWQLSSARTRWGSCTSAGRLHLNWRLIQAPPAVLDYVIAHELAHLVHMNHSPAFWAETARLFPDWQAARHWLKQHGSSLFHFD